MRALQAVAGRSQIPRRKETISAKWSFALLVLISILRPAAGSEWQPRGRGHNALLLDQLLDAPVQGFRDVDFFAGAHGDPVREAELPRPLPRFAEDAEDFSVQVQLQDAFIAAGRRR